MSDDAQTPEAQENGAGRPRPTGGTGEPADAPRDPWAAPSDEGHDRPAAGSKTWPTPPQDTPAGPGATIADTGATARPTVPPTSTPSSSVHDQQTVTSMPGVDGKPPVGGPEAPQPWTSPFAPPNPSAPADGSDNPFAAPNPTAPVNPGPAGTFPPPGPVAPFPAAPYGQEQVPPPPIAPGGPGQAPYGYPGGYGYPAPPGHGAHGPQAHGVGGYYGWPGMAPAPNNGMGTAALVIGIVSAVGFCMWPIAIIGGILAVVLGVLARQKARRGESTNAGQALAGIICGSVGLALSVGMIALLVYAS